MVSLWPWKADSSSAAQFEKTLSALSRKLTNANLHGSRLASRARRLKALWTLYTIFAYILGCLILFLVTGSSNWRPVEYAVVVASPILIYGVRYLITTYYNYRMSKNQAYVDDLEQQKEAAISKLKEATKYNSTQELLEKYGAVKKQAERSKPSPPSSKRQPTSRLSIQSPARTGLPPPPTANIPRPQEQSSPILSGPVRRTPYVGDSSSAYGTSPVLPGRTFNPDPPAAEFAPNAFTASAQYAIVDQGNHRWYDRLMDVILGEDETRASNRLALICTHCRLVNGQAPPGMKSLGDVGRWRCSNCKEWNGQARDVQEILAQASKDERKAVEDDKYVRQVSEAPSTREQTPLQSVEMVEVDDGASVHKQILREAERSSSSMSPESKDSVEDIDTPPAKSTRSRTRNAR